VRARAKREARARIKGQQGRMQDGQGLIMSSFLAHHASTTEPAGMRAARSAAFKKRAAVASHECAHRADVMGAFIRSDEALNVQNLSKTLQTCWLRC
jgi:hypothetical protein